MKRSVTFRLGVQVAGGLLQVTTSPVLTMAVASTENPARLRRRDQRQAERNPRWSKVNGLPPNSANSAETSSGLLSTADTTLR